MICGMDVYHDSIKKKRSVAGFVASLNAQITRWYSRACTQEPNQELMDCIKAPFLSALKKYYEVS